MENVILVIHMFLALAIIGLVLLFISNSAFERMVTFALQWLSPGKLRIGGVVGILFGGLLIFWSL